MAGPEFGELAGHHLIVDKALYGLQTSGQRWHDRLAQCMRSEGFTPCCAEPDIWMQPNGKTYEYVAVYIDDLALALKDPEQLINNLQNKHGFKFKGTRPIKYHLGANFEREPNGTLSMSPKKYITERLTKSYKNMFGERPSTKFLSPLEHGDHPELDDSDLLGPDGIQKYQSLIGALQWTISLGCFDIACSIMSLSSFHVAPQVGHLEQLKRICGYLLKMQNFKLHF